MSPCARGHATGARGRPQGSVCHRGSLCCAPPQPTQAHTLGRTCAARGAPQHARMGGGATCLSSRAPVALARAQSPGMPAVRYGFAMLYLDMRRRRAVDGSAARGVKATSVCAGMSVGVCMCGQRVSRARCVRCAGEGRDHIGARSAPAAAQARCPRLHPARPLVQGARRATLAQPSSLVKAPQTKWRPTVLVAHPQPRRGAHHTHKGRRVTRAAGP